MKKIPVAFFYIAAGILLAAYIYFFERGPVKEKEAAKKPTVFQGYVADDIQEIRVENLSATKVAERTPIVLKKDEKDVWHITAPHAFKADENTIRGLLSSAADMTPDPTIEEPGNLAEYGLNTPVARCSFVSKSGTTFTLVIGEKNVTGSSVYVMTPPKKQVHLLAAYTVENFHKPLSEYRDKGFFKTDGVLAKRVTIVRDGKTTIFEKNKDNAWVFVQPLQCKADDQKVRDLLNTVGNLRLTSFVEDHPSNLSAYGLTKPHASIEVLAGDGKTKDSILLGREKAKADQFFAKSGQQPYVVLVNKYFDKTLDIDPKDYREKGMMKFDAASAKSLTIEHNGKTYVYQKDAQGQWVSPGRAKAQDEGIYLTNALSNTTVMEFAAGKVSSGLQHPSYIVKVGLASGNERIYRFGNTQKEKVFLASDQGKDVLLVSSGVIGQMDLYFNSILTPVAISSPASK